MTTTTNFGLPIYGNSDKPKWTDTNEAFQDLDNKVADKTADNAFTGTNAFNADLLMKGGSTIESDDGVITPTAPSSDKTGTDVIQINDSAGNPLYKVRPIQHSNGKVDLDIAGQPAANGGALTFNGEEVGGKHAYSTAEHVIGTWIDGKPLYERTYVLSKNDFTYEASYLRSYIISSGSYVIVSVPQSVIRLQHPTAGEVLESGITFYVDDSGVPSAETALIQFERTRDDSRIWVSLGSTAQARFDGAIVTLQYYKTTD